MVTNLNGKTAALLCCILLPFFVAWATGSAVGEEPVSQDSQADTAALQVTPSLQHDFEQLMYCFATAADLTGAGDGQAAAEQLRSCFTNDAATVDEFPPAWDHLNTTITGGPQAFAQFGVQFFQSLGVTRTQHMVGNIVVKRTGATTAVMRSYGFATNVYPDESVFHVTGTYVDDVRYINGHWKITHRLETVTSLTEAPAWTGAPPRP
jgi:hypothetical protein